jgi:DNA-binding transcriptional MerR regulator
MNENIDQFGRTNKELKDRDILDNKHIDQSKKIKDSLAEIKEQLINENFKIQLNENHSAPKETITSKVNSSTSKIKELEDKIDNIESEFKKEINIKLNSIEEKITNLNNYSHNEKKKLNNQKL